MRLSQLQGNVLHEATTTGTRVSVLNKQRCFLCVCFILRLSIPAEGLITGSLKRAGSLIYAALIAGISMRQLKQPAGGINISQLGMCLPLQGCTSPAATRTATTGECSVTRAEESAGAPTSTARR